MSDKALYLDYEYCSGCHSCEIACRNELGLGLDQWGIKVIEEGPRQLPDGAWHWNYLALPTELCDLCEGRVAKGELPACVLHCQAKVLEYGTIEECAAKLAAKGSKAAIFAP